MQTTPSAWLAAYLCYSEPWEDFLREAVTPFVQKMMETGLADQYFFIRYWERGPHIRLRFRGKAPALENQVKPALVAHFQAYFEAHPSHRTEPPWLPQLPKAQQWFPNHSVQFIAYEPETERYGGPTGLLIAERQFQASSEAVLAALIDNREWDYHRAMGIAIQLHLGFAAALGMDRTETVCFFSRVFENWLPKAYGSPQQPLSRGEWETRRANVLDAFRRTYQKQKPLLLPLLETVWRGLENQLAFEQAWYNQWLHAMHTVKVALHQAQSHRQLVSPSGYTCQPGPFSSERQQLWAIFDSYVHMTNNRLGILNRDEGYLAYLIRESFTEKITAPGQANASLSGGKA